MQYSQAIIDRLLTLRYGASVIPRPEGETQKSNTRRSQGAVDTVNLFLTIENEHIAQARFRASGSVVMLTLADAFCEHLEGLPISDVLKITETQILSLLQLPALHIPVAALLVNALNNQIKEAQNGSG